MGTAFDQLVGSFASVCISALRQQRARLVVQYQAFQSIGAVETIHETLFYTLALLKKSLNLHTCILLWLDDAGEHDSEAQPHADAGGAHADDGAGDAAGAAAATLPDRART